MKTHSDIKLLKSKINIDLILGGHDHHYHIQFENNSLFVKSGSDFSGFNEITIDIQSLKNKDKIKQEPFAKSIDIVNHLLLGS